MTLQQLAPLIKEFVNSSFWEQSKALLETHPNLLSDDAEAILSHTLEQYGDDQHQSRIVKIRWNLLKRCRRNGVDASFAEYPSILDVLIEFVNTRTWAEKKQIMELNQDRLLADPALELLSYLLMQQIDDTEMIGYLHDCWTVLERCRKHCVEETFNELMHPTKAIVQSDLARRMLTAASQEELDALEREHPEMAPLVRHLKQIETKLAEMELLCKSDDVPRCVEVCREAIALLNPTLLPLQWAASHLVLGDALMRQSSGDRTANIEEAIDAYGQALYIYSREHHPENWARVQKKLGEAQFVRISGNRSDNLEQAIGYFQSALAEISPEASPRDWASAHINFGEAYRHRLCGERSDNIEQAIKHFQQGLEIWSQKGLDRDGLALIRLNLSAAYFDRINDLRSRNLQQSIQHAEKVLALADPKDSPDLWGKAHISIASAHVAITDFNIQHHSEVAIDHYRQGLKVLSRERFPAEWALIQVGLGNSYSKRVSSETGENVELAINHYCEALQIYTRDLYPFEWAMIQENLGSSYSERVQGDPTKNLNTAAQYLNEALTIYEANTFPIDRLKTLRILGNLYFGRRNWEPALAAFDEAIKLGDTLLAGAFSVFGRQADAARTSRMYTQAAYCLLQMGDSSGALVLLEQGKARLLNQSLALDEADIDLLPGVQREAFLNASRSIRELESEMRLSPNTPGRRDNAELGQLLSQSRGVVRSAAEAIRASRPDWWPTDFALRDLLALVPCGGALVVPLATTQGGAVFVLPHGQSEVLKEHVISLETLNVAALRRLLGGAQGEGGWLNGYFHWLNGGPLNDWKATIDRVTAQLWELLIGPVHTRLVSLGLTAGARVVIVPQQPLGLLPLHGASRPVNDGLRSLLDDYIVTYVPSLYALSVSMRRADKARRHTASLFAVSNPIGDLPFATIETQLIAGLFDVEAQLTLGGGRATPEAVMHMIPGRTFLHFSCHGYFDWEDAMNSALVLAGGKPLTLGQIAPLNLGPGGARLVTLSACETGLVQFADMVSGNVGVDAGEEYIGLQGGFLQAGFPGVVSSLWAVNDLSTAFLMGEFYRRLLKEMQDVALALRGAQLWLRDATAEEIRLVEYYERAYRESNRCDDEALRWMRYYRANPKLKPFNHPYYWAGFIFSGA